MGEVLKVVYFSQFNRGTLDAMVANARGHLLKLPTSLFFCFFLRFCIF